ncbi:REP-associated tyrosine transposase [Halomonas alimentaria]|uniref:Transposase n=1 Tax=Halomonas alimentaria TaxID=147248 RepID=A0A7X4W5G9_9GAMM|nr:transposase [Halomonas alimentaria]NAW34689.1 transposase [Halomonas alimentaria]
MSPRSHALRRGRRSLEGHYYLVTAVTLNRARWFDVPEYAQAACRAFNSQSITVEAGTLAFVVMPDHVHWLLELHGNLSEAVRRYKAIVSHRVGAGLWQRGFHDHCIRKEDNVIKAARYIVANPLRVGIVDDILQYPYWDAVWLSSDS